MDFIAYEISGGVIGREDRVGRIADVNDLHANEIIPVVVGHISVVARNGNGLGEVGSGVASCQDRVGGVVDVDDLQAIVVVQDTGVIASERDVLGRAAGVEA